MVITGASSGLGEALARFYAAEGTVLGLVARRPCSMQSVGRTETYSADVTDAAGMQAVADDFVMKHGAPDLVIANAGVGVGTRGDDLGDAAKLRRVLEVNVIGLAVTLAAFAPAMCRPGWLYDRLGARAPRKPRNVAL